MSDAGLHAVFTLAASATAKWPHMLLHVVSCHTPAGMPGTGLNDVAAPSGISMMIRLQALLHAARALMPLACCCLYATHLQA
jgi:hypothetical protein